MQVGVGGWGQRLPVAPLVTRAGRGIYQLVRECVDTYRQQPSAMQPQSRFCYWCEEL